MATIDPRVLQALASGQDIGQYGYMTSQYQPGYWQGGDAGNWVNSGPAQTNLVQGLDKNTANVFDSNGNFLGLNSGDTDSQGLTKFVLTALAMYGGANALAGMGGGAGAAGGAGADLAAAEGAGTVAGGSGGVGIGGSAISLTPAEIAAGVTAPTTAEVMATMPALGAGAGGAAGGLLGASGGGGTSGVNSMRAGEMAGYSTNGSMPSSAAVASNGGSLLGMDYGTWAKLAGAALGAASAKDQQQTSTQNREPWGPAQQLIKDNIASTGLLQKYYQQNPMSQLQQQAYGNQFGLLNSANQNMPAWLAAMNANSSGANNYDPKKPRTLIGGTAQSPLFGLLNPKFGG